MWRYIQSHSFRYHLNTTCILGVHYDAVFSFPVLVCQVKFKENKTEFNNDRKQIISDKFPESTNMLEGFVSIEVETCFACFVCHSFGCLITLS